MAPYETVSEGGRLKKVWTSGGRGVAAAETVGHAACVEFCKRRPAPDGTVSVDGGKNVREVSYLFSKSL